jgi:hypothetical protein
MQYPHSDLHAQLQATGVFELHIPLSHVSLRRRLALAIGALLAVAFFCVPRLRTPMLAIRGC